MDRPDVALKTYLEDNWSLTTTGLTADDISFQNSDWTDNQILHGKPIIVIKDAGFTQLQAAEKNTYMFTFIVEAAIHSPSVTETDDKRTLQWLITEHLKSIFDAFTLNSITGWHSVQFAMGTNPDVAEALPENVITDVTVRAIIAWNVT